jgi:hypothetical protein
MIFTIILIIVKTMDIIAVLTNQNNRWSIYQINDKYCLSHECQIKQYYNDGTKEDETYYFYKDVKCGYKKLIKFSKENNQWSYSRYINEIPHEYSDWCLVKTLTVKEIVPKFNPNYK